MASQICFMIMPYGIKSTSGTGNSAAPDKIDFDRLWELALRPAIVKAGYEPVRADRDVDALIITEMIERLAVSDLVLADVSIPNGNVYYEVGIRHAAQKKGCILTAADWSEPLFDIDQMRRVTYPLPDESVSKKTAKKIVKTIANAIPKMKAGKSPFYQVFPKYPKYSSKLDVSSRRRMEALSQFQAKVSAARQAQGDNRRERALALREEYTKAGDGQKSMAMELMHTLRDCTDWNTTLEFIDGLPDDLRNSPTVKEQRALALSKSGDHDTAIGALLELIESSGDSSERRGLLGGRYKKRWKDTGDQADLSRAIAEYEAGMKLDLNDYYPSSNLARLYRTRNFPGDDVRARISAAVTLTACERARQKGSGDPWLNPTLLGAAFDAGDVEKAQKLAVQVQIDGPAAWEIETTLEDLKTSSGLHEEPRQHALLEIVAQLEAMLPQKPE